MKRYLACLALCVIAACAPVSTGVQQFSKNEATISSRGNVFASTGDIKRDMMANAATVTLKNGYDYFVIVSGGDATYHTDYLVTSDASGPSLNSYTKPSGGMTIRMYNGTLPAGNPDAYDAHEVLQYTGQPVQ